MRTLLTERLREELEKGGVRELARRTGVSHQFLSMVVSGRRRPGPRLLAYLGLREVVHYEYLPAAKARRRHAL
jgi:transcriptional regulator with XRE-family HTH domain